MGRKGYTNLNSFRDVRLFLSRLINQRNNNQITTQKFRDLVYGVGKLQNVLESIYLQTVIETRLSRLEGAGKRPALFSQRESVDGESEEHPEGH